MWQAGSPTVRNNIFRRNRANGISMVNYCDANIIQNLFIENTGDGINWLVPLGGRGPWVINNTIVNNGGAGIYADGYDGAAQIVNNIIVGNPALYVGGFNDVNPPAVEFNDIYSLTGAAYSGIISNLTGIAGIFPRIPFSRASPAAIFIC